MLLFREKLINVMVFNNDLVRILDFNTFALLKFPI